MDQIQSIEAFVTVVHLESFTRAARRLNLSLASLSRAVSDLESHTQTRLVIRSSRFVSLAPGAREFFDICVDALDRLREGKQRLLEDRAKARGVLRIAVHPIAIEAGLPKVVRQYQHGAPEVEVILNTQTGPMRLEHDKFELAVCPPNLILTPGGGLPAYPEFAHRAGGQSDLAGSDGIRSFARIFERTHHRVLPR